MRLAVGDASTFPLPAGDLVLFLYNPFGAELIAKVVAGVEAALAADHRSVYIVYYNPVFGHCFDASPLLLRRRFARVLPYAAEELGYGPDKDDALVIWQGGAAPSPITPATHGSWWRQAVRAHCLPPLSRPRVSYFIRHPIYVALSRPTEIQLAPMNRHFR